MVNEDSIVQILNFTHSTAVLGYLSINKFFLIKVVVFCKLKLYVICVYDTL